MRRRRGASGWALALLFAGVGLVATAATASAHAALSGSSPAAGASLEAAPDRISLTFTEPPDLDLTTIGVVSSSGAPVPTGPPEAGATDREVRVRLEGGAMVDGVYTVTWRTVSRTDGHVTASAFTFGVGVGSGQVPSPEPGAGAGSPTPSALSILGRWSLYVGLAVLLGAGLGGLLAFGTMAVSRPWVLGVAWLLAAIGAFAITVAERAAVGVPLGTLLASDAGGAFVRLGVAIALLGLVVLVTAVRTTRGTLVLLAAGASAAMLVRADGGHAGGSLLEVILQWLHLVGVGVWIGGLVWLALALRPAPGRGLEPAGVRRFSNLAAGGLALLALTGLLRSSNELGITWWLHPLRTGYSTALGVKVLLFVPLIALGAANRFRNVPGLETRGTRPLLRTVGGELALAAGILVATSVMTGLPPVASSEPASPVRPLVVTAADFATTTRVRLEIAPGTVGPNDFRLIATDYDTRQPVHANRVSLSFDLPDRPEVASSLQLERSGGAWQAGGTNLALEGTWTVTALIETETGSVEVPLEVTPRFPAQQIQVSRQPGQPDLYTITVQGGVQIQAYVDPGTPGRTNQVHVTAFTPAGDELPLRSAVVSVTPPGGAATTPEPLRFGPGHFAANIDLTAGSWTFAIQAQARDGRALVASFEQSFGS